MTLFVLLIVAIFYLLFGALTAFYVACELDPKSEEQAEAAATLCVFCGMFWPFIAVLLLLGAVFESGDIDETEV